MADRNANIRINLDNKQAVDGLKKMNKSVKDTGKEVESATTRLGEMMDRLADMKRGSKEFKNLEKEAAKLQNTVDTVNARVTALSSDTFQLEGATQVVGGMVSMYGGLQGAMALTGVESERLLEVMVKLQAVQQVSQSIQEVGLMLRKDSVAAIFLQTKAQKIRAALTSTNIRINRVAASVMGTSTAATNANTTAIFGQSTATKGATLATRALSTAMKAIPILALIGGVTSLITYLVDWSDETENLEERQKSANEQIERNIELIDQQIDAIRKRSTERQEDVDLVNQEEYLDLQRQILLAEQSLAIAKEENSENTDLILKRTRNLNALQLRLTKLEQQREREAFERRLSNTQEEREAYQDRSKAITAAIKEQNDIIFQAQKDLDEEAEESARQRLKELKKQQQENHETFVDLIDDEQNATQQRINLQKKQENELLKLRIDNSKKIREITKDTSKDVKETVESELPSITLSLARIIPDTLKDIPDQLDKTVLTPYAEALTQMYRNFYEQQQEQLALNEELLGRTLENVYKLSDGIQSAIDQDFDSINVNLRMVSENLLGEGGLFQKFRDEGKSFAEFFRDNMTEIVSEVGLMTTQILSKMNTQFVEEEERKIDRLNQRQSDALQRQLSEREISQEQYNNRVQELEQTTEMKRRQLARREFQREKALALVDAGILTAKSVLQAIAQFGPPPSPAGIAGIAAASAIGATQMALIGSQTFQAARGGVVPGEGLGSEDTVPSMLAPGEVVINSESARAFMPLLSMLNEAGGGMQLVPDMEEPTQPKRRVYRDNSPTKQPVQAFVAFDSMDYMNKQVNRTIKNNSF